MAKKWLGTTGIENHGVHAHSMSNYCLSQNQALDWSSNNFGDGGNALFYVN